MVKKYRLIKYITITLWVHAAPCFVYAMELFESEYKKKEHALMTVITADNREMRLDPAHWGLLEKSMMLSGKKPIQLSNPAGSYIDLSEKNIQQLLGLKASHAYTLGTSDMVQLMCTAHYLQLKHLSFYGFAKEIKKLDIYQNDPFVKQAVEKELVSLGGVDPKKVTFNNGKLIISDAQLTSLHQFCNFLCGYVKNSDSIQSITLEGCRLPVMLPQEMRPIINLPHLRKIRLKNTHLDTVYKDTFCEVKNNFHIVLDNNTLLKTIEPGAFAPWHKGSIRVKNSYLSDLSLKNIQDDLNKVGLQKITPGGLAWWGNQHMQKVFCCWVPTVSIASGISMTLYMFNQTNSLYVVGGVLGPVSLLGCMLIDKWADALVESENSKRTQLIVESSHVTEQPLEEIVIE